MTKRQRRANWIAVLIGLGATLAVIAGHVSGMLDWLELLTLDLRFRFANSIEPSDEIVCLDITDRDLETIGRWPWPRDQQAPLIAIPAECGARAILVDLTWTEPESARTETVAFADIVQAPATQDNAAAHACVFPDLALSRVIADADNVYLAYHHAQVDIERCAEFSRLIGLLLKGNEYDARTVAAEFAASLRRRVSDAEDLALQRPWDRARLVKAFIEQPTLSESDVARRFPDFEPFFRERVFERCRDAALRWRLRAWLG